MRALAPILILSFASLAGPLAAAGGGGGGGGGSMPSQSAPAYDPVVEYQNGIAALGVKDFKAARRAFDRVLAMAPKDANANYLAGAARVGLEDWKGARRFLEKAVKLDPDLLGAQRDLGVAYAKLGDRVKAEAVLATLTAKSQACAQPCGQAAQLKAAMDAISAALAAAPVASALAPMLFAQAGQGDAHYLDAVGLINEGRFEEAIASLNAARQSFGPHPDILTYLGFAHRKLRAFEQAEGYYRAALAAAPGHRGALEYYGELKVERGDLKGARGMLAKLDSQCRFGCAEAEELRAWIKAGRSPHS